MVIKSAELETVCGITSKLPDNTFPEIAFAGKSNVGKSSLINSLLNRKSLARTSASPGKTQTINFYNINKNLYFVDLPGYGSARANIEIKAKWGQMIENYLHKSKMLKAVFLLIDIRHEPSENDVMMYEWMVNQGFAPIIIATKADKVKRGKINEHIWRIEKTLNVEPGTIVIPFSAETKDGRSQIWELIDSLVLDDETRAALAAEQELKKAKKRAQKTNAGGTDGEPQKKQRWKKTGKPVAKKTAKKAAAKKAVKRK